MNDGWTALLQASIQTLYMVTISTALSVFFGLMIGAWLFFLGRDRSSKGLILSVLGFIVNVMRSIPFIILLILIIPLTRWCLGTSIGTNAALFSLTLAAIPFYARLAQSSFQSVPVQLVEVGESVGCQSWQLFFWFLLPEARPSLVRGATLTAVSLVGYSAMAGVVGGGGLGELAVNYGYERFNGVVMLQTVVVLVLLTQCIQRAGDYLASRRRLSYWLAVLVVWFFGWLLAFNVSFSKHSEASLRLGVMSGPSESIMRLVKEKLWRQYHWHLQLVTFNDYTLPNVALADGSIDANLFQHVPFLEDQMRTRHFKFKVLARTFIYPLGFYSKTIDSLASLPDGAKIAVASDPSNQARALRLLSEHHMIVLNVGHSLTASLKDITANPHHYRFVAMASAQLPRVLDDVALVAINNDFLSATGLSPDQALLLESSDSPYANVLVARANQPLNHYFQQLIEVLHSQSVVAMTHRLYPGGGAIIAWKKTAH